MNLATCARSRIAGRRHVFSGALALALAALPALNAAEFEAVDKLTANGFTLLKSSAEVRGLLGISTGVPYAALDVVSTGTASNIYAQIWRDGGGVVKASMTSEGVLYATFPPGAGGDHLGNHTATTDLNMTAHSVLSVASVTMLGTGLQIGTDLTSSANGLFISTAGQVFTVGLGNGAALPNARGIGAVDLQTRRVTSVQVASGTYAVISGGYANTASGDAAAVAGGWGNTASGARSFAAGNGNAASGAYASITGGTDSTASGSHAVIGGGNTNEASGDHSAVVGGLWSTASGDYSVVGAGYESTASGDYSSVLGGKTNTAAGGSATVLGGEENVAQGFGSLAGGMGYNYAGGDDSIVLSAYSTTTAYGSAIVGGEDHFASGDHSAVMGGYDNTVSGDQAFIGGGNTIDVRGEYSGNVGGRYNIVHGSNSFIGGGDNNQAFGFYTAILGGDFNWAYANESAVVGGNSNGAYGEASAILGGVNNRTYGFGSIVLGGDRNHAAGDYSFAAGRTSSSTANGSFTWADSQGGTTVRTINNIADRTLFKNRGGFMITGSTNTYMTGTSDRGVLVTGDGLVGISTGMPYAALDVVSTGTASDIYAQVWRNGGGVVVASMTSQGVLYATLPPGAGDNLGDHKATQALDLDQFPVVNVSSISMVGNGIRIATSVYSGASGIFISSGGAIQTIGVGHGTVAGNPRGLGAVDLQAARTSANYAATGLYSVIGGGLDNRASNSYAVVSGGYQNEALQTYTTVSGGGTNEAQSTYSTVAGGFWNYASGSYAVISGGGSNRTYNTYSSIGGGNSNDISGDYGTIGGGYYNRLSSTYGAIGGGNSNRVSGSAGTVPGGANNTAKGVYSLAAGYYSSSTANGTFTWADATGQITENNVANRTWFKNSGGFLINGSTNPYMAGENDRGVLVTGDGLVGISTGVPYAALDVVSSATASNVYAQIWRNGSGVVVASMTSEGKLFADGSGLTGVNAASGGTGGDNLGSHIATMTLQMQGFGINTSSDVSAAAFQIFGSTVLFAEGSNINVGIGAGASQLVQHDNTYLGYNAGYAHTGNGSGNVFIGSGAGENVTYSDYNVFIGAWAGGNENSSENIFIGAQAGMSATGSQNTMVGIFSGTSVSNGEFNSFFGYNSGLEATTGNSSTLIGYEAGKNSTIGTANSILGAGAGRGTYGSAIYSSATIVGSQAGYSLTSGNDNIFLGYKAGYAVTTGTGNIVIGYGKDTSAPGANNELNIGGVLFGKLDTRTIGIGTNNPLAALEVRSYSDGNYTAVVSTSSTAGVYSVAVTSTGVTNINNLVIENRTSDPVAPVTGQIWFRVD